MLFREIVKMPERELSEYRQLPMWQGRIQLMPTVARELAAGSEYVFHPERFASLHVPTTLLLGGDSPETEQRAARVLDSALPNSRIVVLPNQQHIAMDIDPEAFVSVLLGAVLTE
jgi:pimeloyl-ACP methyl ester carboxylesterase